ncbi:MAG: electron transporter RnfD [Gammaproteobacteria bacterium SG8_11]|nr:MAG: electron transporter RnfD [Gammaproteobacteria bacterium SG8_11]
MSTLSAQAAPHTHGENSVSRIMLIVILALLPATGWGIYQFGWPALNILVLSIISALLAEAVCLRLANKPVSLFLQDGSAVLTAWLLAMTLPPWTPWWIAVFGGMFAIIIGKQIFGGVGQNVFNPAMLARVALLVSFPVEMTFWVTPKPLFSEGSPNFFEGLAITFLGVPDLDAVSSASIIGHVKTGFTQGHSVAESLSNAQFDVIAHGVGTVAGSMGETSALLIALGGLVLIALRIITWHIPVTMLGTVALLATLFNLIAPEQYPDAMFHLLSGGLMLGAFFIATDLVTSPSTRLGQLIFGAGCGALVFVIRSWGAFPEGVGFAVLLMNAATPLIDHYIRPRIYGRNRKGEPLTIKDSGGAT